MQLRSGWFRYATGSFPRVDDGGYMVLVIEGWRSKGGLYDQVFSQYGPFHVLFFGGPLKVFDVTLTAELGRMITLGLQTATSVAIAIAVRSITRSIGAAVAAQIVSFVIGNSLAWVPLHPGGLIMALIAALFVNVAVVRPKVPRSSDLATGALLAALLLTKINVGGMVLAAVLFTMAQARSSALSRRWVRGALTVGVVIMGPVLFLSHLGVLRASPILASPFIDTDPTAVILCWSVLYVAAALAAVTAARSRSPEVDGSPTVRLVTIGFLATGIVACGAVLLRGTSVSGLIDGVVVRPTGQAGVLAFLPPLSPTMFLWIPGVIGMIWAFERLRSASDTVPLVFSGVLRVVAAGLLLMHTPFVPDSWALTTNRLAFLPLAALVAVPTDRSGSEAAMTARRLLAVLAVTHSLHAFPVAGAQMQWAVWLSAVAGVVIGRDGLDDLMAANPAHARLDRPMAMLGLTVVSYVGLSSIIQETDASRQVYDTGVQVDIPGMTRLRMGRPMATTLEWVSQATRDCDLLISYPGMGWTNLASGTPTPTGYNTTLWNGLLNEHEQEKTVAVMEQTNGPVCFIHDFPNVAWTFDAQGGGTLLDYLASSRFEFVDEFDGLTLMVKR